MIGVHRLSSLAQLLSAHSCQGDGEFDRVSTDTRTLEPGALFVALSGPNFDGNSFVAQAAAKGACAAVVSELQALDLPQLLVADTQQVLGLLGKLNRDAYPGAVVAVTGSSGKTSVKDMLAEVLRTKGPVLATQGNLNNEIGVPLTLLRLSPEQPYGVIEMGASGAGEIAYAVGLTRPQVAVLTNAGGAHLEGFGSLAGVVAAKGEIFDGLRDGGVGVVNHDDPHADIWLQRLAGKQAVTFSLCSAEADLFASHLDVDKRGCYHFVLNTHQDQIRVRLNVMGRHAVANALAVSAAAVALGLTLAEIAPGLQRFQGTPGRLAIKTGIQQSCLIDDTYNANPESVRAAIRVLAELAGERVLVLGDMAELGDERVALHAELGGYAREQGVEQLIAVGDLAAHAARAFGDQGKAFATHAQALNWLQGSVSNDSVILVKGSRSSRMEEIVLALTSKDTF